MITWMQRHKKWLVVVIWISTIMFVGAGFVGWGSYNYGSKGGVVATVGDREVTSDEYQQVYASLYTQYSNMFGSSFNQELADKMNLKGLAFNQVLQNNLVLSYADELGLAVTDEDIAKKLVEYKAFVKDGKFDKDTYIKVLNQNRTNPAKFEAGLKRGILLSKVIELFNLKPNKAEIENFSKLLFMKDDIEYKVLSTNNIKVDVKEDELKKYWEKNKNSYKSEISYDLLVEDIPFVSITPTDKEIKNYYDKFKLDYKKDDGKLKSLDEAKDDIIKDLSKKATKTKALKQYLKYKKGEMTLKNKEHYTKSKLSFGVENNKKILQAKANQVLKPFVNKDRYTIVQVKQINSQKVLSFEEARQSVLNDYTSELKNKKLDKLAQDELKTFKGTVLKAVTKNSITEFKNLNKNVATEFLVNVFTSPKKQDVVRIGNQAILYKVLNSKFGQYNSSNDKITDETILSLQNQEMMSGLLKNLEKRYEIKSYIEEKE